MINTLNESSLHKTLKNIFAIQTNAQQEVKIGNWICDLVTSKGDVIEIQNQNVSSLLPKIQYLLSTKHKVTVVHPIIVSKTIETYDSENKLLSKRRSPKKQDIYSIFRELTGLYTVLLHKNFTLVVPEITVSEIKIKTPEPVQLINKSRRFRKNWIKTNKSLNTIGKSYVFKGKKDYLSLLPLSLEKEFSSKELKMALSDISHNASLQANLILWLYSRMEIIENVYIKNRLHYYHLK